MTKKISKIGETKKKEAKKRKMDTEKSERNKEIRTVMRTPWRCKTESYK